MYYLAYSTVPNRSAGTFINFEEKFPPARSYFGLHFINFEEISPLHINDLKNNSNISLKLPFFWHQGIQEPF
jgi:hypothetical protein